jgi:predicted RNA binding protein YcfA (HicA-like mRNA interferase family)
MTSPLRGVSKDHRDLIQKALDQGWTLTRTKSGHLRLTPPDGGDFIITAKTSGGGRGERNLRSLLRQRGVDC